MWITTQFYIKNEVFALFFVFLFANSCWQRPGINPNKGLGISFHCHPKVLYFEDMILYLPSNGKIVSS